MNIRVEFCNELPDALIVGVGYPVTGTLTEILHKVMHLRMRDFVLGREEWRSLRAGALPDRLCDSLSATGSASCNSFDKN